MLQHLPKRETVIWLILVAVSCLSWELAGQFSMFGDVRIIGCALIAIAFIKTRFVLMEFMELKNAPFAARLFAEAWWLGNTAILIGLFWMSSIVQL